MNDLMMVVPDRSMLSKLYAILDSVTHPLLVLLVNTGALYCKLETTKMHQIMPQELIYVCGRPTTVPRYFALRLLWIRSFAVFQ